MGMQTLSSPNVNGLGDPIILYHHEAQRWFITQFASSGNKLLVYVSESPDPQGNYFLYQFSCPGFPDYPKWSIAENADMLLMMNKGLGMTEDALVEVTKKAQLAGKDVGS